jgi:hypothetical protein
MNGFVRRLISPSRETMRIFDDSILIILLFAFSDSLVQLFLVQGGKSVQDETTRQSS